MRTEFESFRDFFMWTLNDVFACKQRMIRDPNYAEEPHSVSKLGLLLGSVVHFGGVGKSLNIDIESKELEHILEIALPIILGFAAGYSTCVSNKYCVTTWLLDFANYAATNAIFIEIIKRDDLSSREKTNYRDVLFTALHCAFLALDKLRNSNLPLTAHCAYAVLSTFTCRVVTHNLDFYQWHKDDKYVLDVILQQMISIALVFPVQGLFQTRLKYSWKILAADFVLTSLASTVLYCRSSPIVKWAEGE